MITDTYLSKQFDHVNVPQGPGHKKNSHTLATDLLKTQPFSFNEESPESSKLFNPNYTTPI
jgi:hypothetical protein